MEVKDIVIDIRKGVELPNDHSLLSMIAFTDEVAEISFKVGYKQRQPELRIEVGSIAFKKGKKAGIREVVEDLSNHLTVLFLIKASEGDTKGMSVCSHLKDRLQTKLKEWEIENGSSKDTG